MKVELYYSGKDEPAKQYYCDNKKALGLCEQLKAKGVTVVVQDCGEQPVSFKTYNAAVTGPSAAKRAVFGAKGALEEDMGKRFRRCWSSPRTPTVIPRRSSPGATKSWAAWWAWKRLCRT